MFLPSAHSMALKPSFPFRLVRCVQAFVLKPASFCKLSADPGSPNKSDTALFISFSLTLFLYVLASLSSPPHFFLFHTLWHIWQKLFFFSFSIQLQWIPSHLFLPGNDTADELTRRDALFQPAAVPSRLSLISHIHSSFSTTVSIPSHQNFSTHGFPHYPTW